MHCLVVPSYYPNSYSPFDGIYFKVQAEALAKNNVKVGVIAPIIIKHYVLLREKKIDYGFKNPENQIPTTLCQLPSFPLIKRMNDWMRLYFGKKLVKKYISRHGLPNIIHVHSFENAIVARWIKNNFGIPFVLTEHSTRFERNEYSPRVLKLAKKAFEEAAEVIVVSSDLQATLKTQFGIEATIIPNLIDTDFFHPQNCEKKYDFISIGGLRDVKNYELLIKTFSNLSNKKTTLAFIGVGPLLEKLKMLVKKLNLENRVSFLGKRTQEEIAGLLNQSKIFVSSSKVETFGVAIIEAMSCGLPVVATKSGGPEYFMTDSQLGELCEHTVDELCKSMTQVYNNLNSYNPDIIRKHVINLFSGQKVTNQLKKVYSKYAISS
ncbi:MAG: glycosyltransferase [Fulvivirga sp.]|uniref:glycosyltransferase n=1 Tax=Fulvivirga sp. TaxID=1931237 RepID=UPI0032EFC3C8